jgi:hypothetical protein
MATFFMSASVYRATHPFIRDDSDPTWENNFGPELTFLGGVLSIFT